MSKNVINNRPLNAYMPGMPSTKKNWKHNIRITAVNTDKVSLKNEIIPVSMSKIKKTGVSIAIVLKCSR